MTRGTPGRRWYQRLLHLYPSDFRDEFGREMAQLYKDRAREERTWRLWGSLLLDTLRTAPTEHLDLLRQDLIHTRRSLLRTPVITATAILTLALAIGAGTAVFSMIHAVLLRPLPYSEPDQLVELFEENLQAGSLMRSSALNYLSWTERSQHVQALGAFRSDGFTLSGDGNPELLSGSVMTASVFGVLRLAPIAGRTLQPGDEQVGSPRVVVLSESLWRVRFGSDPAIVGQSLLLNGERHQIVGVMPRAFREVGRAQIGATSDAQLFVPLVINRANENRGNHTLRVIGRLPSGVRLEQARKEMRGLAAAMEHEFPASNAHWSVRLDKLSDTMIDPRTERSLVLVAAAVVMVFLIACANVANLLLARGTERHVELAVRAALGARRSRLVRQLVTESACLATVSGLSGISLAVIAQPLIRTLLLPGTLPRLDEMQVDVYVLAFGLLVTTVSGLVFGIVPAVRASQLDPMRSLVASGRATMSVSGVQLRRALVVAQMALATMLLVGAALLIQGLIRLQSVPLGFDPLGVLSTRLSLPRAAYPDAVTTAQFYDRLLAALKESGDVEAAAIATSAPFAPGVRAGFQPTGRGGIPAGNGGDEGAAEHVVSDEYFRVLAVPLLAGRSFAEADKPQSTAVAVVSSSFARIWWPDTNPLGQLFERNGRSYEVVGLVGDVRGEDTQGSRGGGPDREPRAAAYFTARQLPQRSMTLLVRSTGDPESVIARVRATVREIDPTVALQQIRPLREWFEDSVAPRRLTTTLAMVFAACALLLASIGIYGVLAFTVSSRTREIGVRIAIGATRRRVIGLILRDGMTWAAGGIVLGLVGAFATATLIATLLFDVHARDPVTFATVGVAVIVVAMIACLVPAVRAVRIDPTIAMRVE